MIVAQDNPEYGFLFDGDGSSYYQYLLYSGLSAEAPPQQDPQQAHAQQQQPPQQQDGTAPQQHQQQQQQQQHPHQQQYPGYEQHQVRQGVSAPDYCSKFKGPTQVPCVSSTSLAR